MRQNRDVEINQTSGESLLIGSEGEKGAKRNTIKNEEKKRYYRSKSSAKIGCWRRYLLVVSLPEGRPNHTVLTK